MKKSGIQKLTFNVDACMFNTAVSLVLKAIKTYGLDKTIEDLSKNMPQLPKLLDEVAYESVNFDRVWMGFLRCIAMDVQLTKKEKYDGEH